MSNTKNNDADHVARLPNRGIISDKNWIRHNFLTANVKGTDRVRIRRSNGWAKFYDTTLGGNPAINAPYQFTRYADPKEKRVLNDVGKGMGRWYSENIDDFGHNVHFRVGVPTYSSVLGYIQAGLDANTAMYVATGREPGAANLIGKVIGGIINIAFWEISLLGFFLQLYNEFTNSRFTYIKPTMFQYWKTVQIIVNAISTNLGITYSASPSQVGGLIRSDAKYGSQFYSNDDAERSDLSAAVAAQQSVPEIWQSKFFGDTSETNADINVFAVASRAQALQARWYKMLETMKDQGINSAASDPDALAAYLERLVLASDAAQGNKGDLKPNLRFKTLKDYMNAFLGINEAYGGNVDEQQSPNNNGDIRSKKLSDLGFLSASTTADAQGVADITSYAISNQESAKSFFQKTVDSVSSIVQKGVGDRIHEALLSEMRDGSQWVTFRTANSADSVSESVSNSLETTSIMDFYNNLSSRARDVAFQYGGGIGIKGIDDLVTGALNNAMQAVTSMVGTGGSMSFFNPFMAAVWGAQLENPKRWSSSSSTLPTASYRFELRCGYANTLSYLQDIVVPLAMLMAMAFPRGTGAQSYGSPYYVQYYSRGRSQAAIGIVSSINITRGVGNAPWLKNGLPMGVDVDITIDPLSEMLYVPAQSGILLNGGIFKSLMNENSMGDYIACLSGLGMVEQEYLAPKVRRRINNALKSFNSVMSPQFWSQAIVGHLPGRLITKLADATSVRN